MTDGANTTAVTVTPQFTTDGFIFDRDITWSLVKRIGCRGPDIAFDLISTETCCDENYLIHLTITIPVIDGEVGICRKLQFIHGLSHRIITIISARVCGFRFGGDLNRTIDIEPEVEASA